MLAPWLWQRTLGEAAVFFLAINIGIVGLSIGLWVLVRSQFRRQAVFTHTKPITASDVLMTCSAALMNAVVSVVGWWAWKRGYFELTPFSWGRTLFDFVALLTLMDFGMYITHRLAHIPGVYEFIHRRHHDHVETNALSLFVLSPWEVLGFGSLLVGVTALVEPTEAGLTLYLLANVFVGTIGHTGVEPIPDRWLGKFPGGLMGTSTFHATHHSDRDHNFGFYTTIWDRMGRTLASAPTGHSDSRGAS